VDGSSNLAQHTRPSERLDVLEQVQPWKWMLEALALIEMGAPEGLVAEEVEVEQREQACVQWCVVS
jgi:hypothetical protein